MSANRIIVACLLAGALGACTSANELQQRFAYRWGPNPAIPASDFASTITEQVGVLDYISYQAFGVHYSNATTQDPMFWYSVAEWGFNVGRQDCEIYMDYMFRLNREKARDDGIIAGLGAASAAIVGVTAKNPAKALSVLAASFGLATAINNAIFDSYLFSEAPGLISIKIAQLQENYRQQVETIQFQQTVTKKGTVVGSMAKPVAVTTSTNQVTGAPGAKPASNTAQPGSSQSTSTTATIVKPITTPEEAYSAIQNYYHICLPHSIEGVLLQAVADSSAKSTSPSATSTPTLTASSTPAKAH